MFDIQAWYIRDYILGEIKLPKSDEMKAETKTWYDRCLEFKICIRRNRFSKRLYQRFT